MITNRITFSVDDIQALRQLLPSFKGETWGQYIDRAMRLSLMTMGEAVYIVETYGKYALERHVT